MQRKLITSTLCALATAMLLVAGSSTASATPIKWFDGAGANGHFYEVIGISTKFTAGPGVGTRTGNLTWATAQTEANGATAIAGYSSSLVTITSQAELDFLMTASGPVNHGLIGAGITAASTTTGVFIGLSDKLLDDTFAWEAVTLGTGTPVVEAFSFTNWDATEPDLGSDNIVTLMTSGLWRDKLTGFTANGFIVEWSPIPEPGSMVLCGLGALAMAGYGWRRRRNRTQTTK